MEKIGGQNEAERSQAESHGDKAGLQGEEGLAPAPFPRHLNQPRPGLDEMALHSGWPAARRAAAGAASASCVPR